jgi:hypothetical protein
MMCLLSWIEAHQGTAAWVQAIASVAAIVAAAWFAVLQSRIQYASALRLQERQRLREEVRLAEAVSAIAKNVHKLITMDVIVLSDRERIYLIQTGRHPFDLGGLIEAEASVAAIPLHSLPTAHMVRLTMILSATIRQFRAKVQNAFENYRNMDSSAYTDFFNSMAQMRDSSEMTANDLGAELNGLKQRLED